MSGARSQQPVITSRHSARVVAARRLHTRAERAKTQQFLVEGPRAIAEAVASGQLVTLFATPAAYERAGEMLGDNAIPVYVATDDVVKSIAETVTPQGLVGIARQHHYAVGELPLLCLACVLVDVADPGNAGTVVRSADAAGADAVVLTRGSVDIYNGKCVRASAGSVFRVPHAVDVDVSEALDVARRRGLVTVVADAHAQQSVQDIDLARPTMWLFGSEAHGLDRTVRDTADACVRLPMFGGAESLNLAASAAICLYLTALAQRSVVQ